MAAAQPVSTPAIARRRDPGGDSERIHQSTTTMSNSTELICPKDSVARAGSDTTTAAAAKYRHWIRQPRVRIEVVRRSAPRESTE